MSLNYMKMLGLLIGITMAFYIACVVFLMIYYSGHFFWFIIWIGHFTLQVIVPSAFGAVIIARLFKFKKVFWSRLLIGIIYSVFAMVALIYHWQHFGERQNIGYDIAIFLICTIIGFVSARALPDDT